ncbi:MAG: hypothetical protein HKN76_04620 [Saprospiraceae bacterium]|nr:hypothetical protein [Saprospiraceae bacterium]
MIDGIKVYTKLSLQDRLSVSQGTETVELLNGKPTLAPTFVPREPWKPVSPNQLDQLRGDTSKPPYQSIGLVRLPNHIRDLWKNTDIESATTEADIQRLPLHPLYSEAIKSTGNWAAGFQIEKEKMIMHNLACISKGLRTVTFNPRENRYLGLHLDSWEKQPLDKLSAVRNRLCINLGRSPRYFLFVNQEIHSLRRMLDMPREGRARTLIQNFLTAFPDYPVLRIKLNPYEAYIAPTENLIHDGSSEDQLYQDVQITLRSFFQVPGVQDTILSKVKHFFSAT